MKYFIAFVVSNLSLAQIAHAENFAELHSALKQAGFEVLSVTSKKVLIVETNHGQVVCDDKMVNFALEVTCTQSGRYVAGYTVLPSTMMKEGAARPRKTQSEEYLSWCRWPTKRGQKCPFPGSWPIF